LTKKEVDWGGQSGESKHNGLHTCERGIKGSLQKKKSTKLRKRVQGEEDRSGVHVNQIGSPYKGGNEKGWGQDQGRRILLRTNQGVTGVEHRQGQHLEIIKEGNSKGDRNK